MFNMETFIEAMSSLNLKSGVPNFIYISSRAGKVLTSSITFVIKEYNKNDCFEYLLHSNKSNKYSRDECIKRLYGVLHNKLDSLEVHHPSIKESFSLNVVIDFFK